jgi:lipopolysaccharide transport system ATP-binding protein
MSDIAIKVEKLSKRYRIGRSTNGYKTLRDTLAGLATAPFRRKMSAPSAIQKSISNSTSTPALASLRSDEIWALKEVSFEVKRGEVVGIIGRNGAGKSTLLKILSRITEPTEGHAEIRGRVRSLLEVGTGFHPELTGRENIYLNGAILGMKKAEIDRKFDEIVSFAEVEKFNDTAIKYYSSGMYVRLAFAVAAHLEPEILLVDEVLAVGDASFQRKCLGKMKDVANTGRTVLFVSHQMGAVQSLCSRALQIHQGEVIQDGKPELVIGRYLSEVQSGIVQERIWDRSESRPGDSRLRLMALRVLNAAGQVQNIFRSSEPILVEVEFELFENHPALYVGFDLKNEKGIVVFHTCHNHLKESEWPRLELGRNKLRCTISPNLLNGGVYAVTPRIALHFIKWIVNGETEVGFEVLMDHCESGFWNASHSVAFPGVIAPFLRWAAVDDVKVHPGQASVAEEESPPDLVS